MLRSSLRRTLPLLLALASVVHAGGADGPRARPVDPLARVGAPGALVLVRDPSGTRVTAHGTADPRGGRAPAPSDRFRAASVTKTFVAAVLLQLVEEGRVRLDDTVERWLPNTVPTGAKVTLRDLLAMRSGLFDFERDEEFRDFAEYRDRLYTPRDFVRIANRHPAAEPGRAFSYSNTNYVLLDLVIERVTGRPLKDELRERIIGPLGLRDTLWPGSARAIPGPHLRGFLPTPTGLLDATETRVAGVGADGALVSSARDLATFFDALLGGRLLRPESLRAMQDVRPTFMEELPGLFYGLGLVRGDFLPCGPVFGNAGDTEGYTTYAFRSPASKRTVVMVATVNPLDARQRAVFTEALAEAMCGAP